MTMIFAANSFPIAVPKPRKFQLIIFAKIREKWNFLLTCNRPFKMVRAMLRKPLLRNLDKNQFDISEVDDVAIFNKLRAVIVLDNNEVAKVTHDQKITNSTWSNKHNFEVTGLYISNADNIFLEAWSRLPPLNQGIQQNPNNQNLPPPKLPNQNQNGQDLFELVLVQLEALKPSGTLTKYTNWSHIGKTNDMSFEILNICSYNDVTYVVCEDGVYLLDGRERLGLEGETICAASHLRNEVFYATYSQIRVIDLLTGHERTLLKVDERIHTLLVREITTAVWDQMEFPTKFVVALCDRCAFVYRLDTNKLQFVRRIPADTEGIFTSMDERYNSLVLTLQTKSKFQAINIYNWFAEKAVISTHPMRGLSDGTQVLINVDRIHFLSVIEGKLRACPFKRAVKPKKETIVSIECDNTVTSALN